MAEDKPSETSKRRLRPAAPTVRQQAEKARASAEKEPRGRRLRSAVNTGKKPLGKVTKLFDRQPFRFLGRVFVPKFVRNTVSEMRQVTWPDTRQTIRLTFAVLLFAIVFATAIGIVDYGLNELFKNVLLK